MFIYIKEVNISLRFMLMGMKDGGRKFNFVKDLAG
jgi:hypothetical protein